MARQLVSNNCLYVLSRYWCAVHPLSLCITYILHCYPTTGTNYKRMLMASLFLYLLQPIMDKLVDAAVVLVEEGHMKQAIDVLKNGIAVMEEVNKDM